MRKVKIMGITDRTFTKSTRMCSGCFKCINREEYLSHLRKCKRYIDRRNSR